MTYAAENSGYSSRVREIPRAAKTRDAVGGVARRDPGRCGATVTPAHELPRRKPMSLVQLAVPKANALAAEPIVTATAVTRRYGDGDTAVDALRGVSLEID